MKKEVKIIRDIDAIKMAVEDTRSKIAALLMVDDMTISQLSEALNKDQSTIYRHLKKLEEAEFVEVTGEKKTHHIPEKKYGRTAGIFLFSPASEYQGEDVMDIPFQLELENAQWLLDVLDEMGFVCESSEEELSNISKLIISLNKKADDQIMEVEDKIKDINYPRLLYLKLILFILELENNPEMKNLLSNTISQLKG